MQYSEISKSLKYDCYYTWLIRTHFIAPATADHVQYLCSKMRVCILWIASRFPVINIQLQLRSRMRAPFLGFGMVDPGGIVFHLVVRVSRDYPLR